MNNGCQKSNGCRADKEGRKIFNTFFYPKLQSKNVCPLATNYILTATTKMSDIMTTQSIQLDYQLAMCNKIQALAAMRNRSKLSQNDVANKLGVSIKTIQRFESYKTFDSYLFFGYNYIFKNL